MSENALIGIGMVILIFCWLLFGAIGGTIVGVIIIMVMTAAAGS